MSHRPAWTCSKCGHQLGEIIAGVVIVWVPKPALGPDTAAVACPRCDTTNFWRYQVQTATR